MVLCGSTDLAACLWLPVSPPLVVEVSLVFRSESGRLLGARVVFVFPDCTEAEEEFECARLLLVEADLPAVLVPDGVTGVEGARDLLAVCNDDAAAARRLAFSLRLRRGALMFPVTVGPNPKWEMYQSHW